jgi:hypothetical protein
MMNPRPSRREPEEEQTMPVVLIHQGPSVTQERYEQTISKLTGGKTRLESPADWPVEGLLMHIAGQSPQGFRVVDVWQSAEACDRFGEVLGPILQQVGIDDLPEMYEAHTFVSA